MTVSASSDRVLSETANVAPRRVIDLRRGGRALGGSYLYEGDALITGWHSHDVHQIEYALHGVVEVETDSAHYLLPPQQAAWIPAGLEQWSTFWTHSLFPDYGFASGDAPVVAYWVSALLGSLIVAGVTYGALWLANRRRSVSAPA